MEYSLRAIPLGGYVAFPDDDPSSPWPADDPDLLRNRGIASRAAVISAGVVANIIFAYTALLVQVRALTGGTCARAEGKRGQPGRGLALAAGALGPEGARGEQSRCGWRAAQESECQG